MSEYERGVSAGTLTVLAKEKGGEQSCYSCLSAFLKNVQQNTHSTDTTMFLDFPHRGRASIAVPSRQTDFFEDREKSPQFCIRWSIHSRTTEDIDRLSRSASSARKSYCSSVSNNCNRRILITPAASLARASGAGCPPDRRKIQLCCPCSRSAHPRKSRSSSGAFSILRRSR